MKKLLDTKRLILRQFEPDDAKHIFTLHNDEDVMKYIPHKKPLNVPMERCEKFISHFISEYEKRQGLGLYAVITKDTNDFIGWNEINFLDNTQEIEIGYRYLKQHWGKGYATETSKALVDYGFKVLKLDKLVGVAMAENTASRKVLKKAGMQYVEMRKYYGVDLAYYEIFNPDL